MPKIYDIFMFNNERLLLELRLNELNPFVDEFVLVEATHTFSGIPKPLFYDEIKDTAIFAPFRDKIVHLVFDNPPVHNRWANERGQRNRADEYLADTAEPDDIIIVSDVDEIINTVIFPVIAAIRAPTKLMMEEYYYFFNCRSNQMWAWPAVCRYRDYKSADFLRNSTYYNGNKYYHIIAVLNAGWHYGYLMSAKEIAHKIESAAHSEYDNDEFKNLNRIQACIDYHLDLFGRNVKYEITELFDGPAYLMANKEKFAEFIRNVSDDTNCHSSIQEQAATR